MDMETEFIARACAAYGVPLPVSLRVVSDTPTELFPAPTNVLFDIERQQTQMLKLANVLFCASTSRPTPGSVCAKDCPREKDLADALADVVRNIEL